MRRNRGQQLLPNKAVLARKPGLCPPYAVDPKQQGQHVLSFAKPLYTLKRLPGVSNRRHVLGLSPFID